MKKSIVMIAMAMALVLCMTAVAGATLVGSVYHFEDADLSVIIPTEYYVLTREIREGDPALEFFGIEKDTAVSFLEKNYLYLDASSSDFSEEVTIAIQANAVDDFRSYSGAVLNNVIKSVEDTFSKSGMEVSKTELYENDKASFLKIYYFDPTVNCPVLQYFTIYDYQTINFRMYSRNGEVSAAQEAILKRIVDTAMFMEL